MNDTIAKIDKIILVFLCLDALCNTVSTAGANIGLGGALLFFLIRFFKYREDIIARWRSFDCIILTGVACFLGATYFSGLFAIDHAKSLHEIMHRFVLRPAALVIIISVVKDKKSIIWLGLSLLGGIIINGLYGVELLVKFSVEHGGRLALERRFSGSVHPVHFGCVLGAAIPALWALLLNYRAKHKYRLWAAMALLLVFLVMSGTRGAWISIALVFVLLLFMSGCSLKKTGLILVAAAVIGGGVISLLPHTQARVASITAVQDGSKLARMQMWQSAANMFRDYPVTGVGAGCWAKAYGEKYMLPEALEKDNLAHAHSNFFQILAEQGMVGIAGYAALVVAVFKCAYMDWKKHGLLAGLMVFAGWLSFFLQGFTEYSMGTFAPSKFLWTSLGMYIAWRYIALPEKDGENA